MALAKDIYRAFEDVVGPDNISADPAILDSYAFRWGPQTQTFVDRFAAVLLPQNTEEVQAIIRLCNKYKVMFKASSTGWGYFSDPIDSSVIKLDLRRMNRILEINEKNMYAVVEPYVISAQLQAELMKRGFNFNIIGAGSNCSAHPFAAHSGIGHMGESTGCRERSILAVEWVAPDGEIYKPGSLGSLNEWFCGDGPGPSLRGIIMGEVAPLGGLGVFTKAATKIYHWPGPKTFPIEGVSPNYSPSGIPPNFMYRYYSFPTVEKMIEAQRKIGESEIAFEVMGFNAAMLASNIATDNEEDLKYFEQFRKSVQGPGFQVIIAAHSPSDFEYKVEVLKQIIQETGGKSLIQVEDPKVAAGLIWRSIRIPASIRECFRAGGAFTAILGGIHTFAQEVKFMENCTPIKKDLISKGLLRDDDGAYLTWSLEYGHLGHAEMLIQFSPQNDEAVQAIRNFRRETANNIAINTCYGVPTGAAGTEPHNILGPHTSNYHLWLKKIKKTFDPNEVSDPLNYISAKE